PASDAGSVKCFRYQPIPAGKNPPDLPGELFLSMVPSMLQSCGTSSLRQARSSNPDCCAVAVSPRLNRQSESKGFTARAAGAVSTLFAVVECKAHAATPRNSRPANKIRPIDNAVFLIRLL